MTSRRHLVPVVAFAAVLVACGSDATTSDPVTTTAAAPSSSATAIPAAPSAPVDMTTLPPPVVAEFRLAGELEQLGDRGTVWAWSPGADVTPEQVGALATALGVQGEIVEQPVAEGGGFSVGAAESAQLLVSRDAQGSWSYSAAIDANCGVDIPPTTAPVEGPVPDLACSPPAGDAEALALELLVGLGLDPADYALTVTSAEHGAWVDAALVLDGVPTQVNTSFAIGPGGALTYASGQLFGPQEVEETGLIGTDAGFARLQSDLLMRAYSPNPGSQDPTRSARPVVGTVAAEPVVVTIVVVEPDWWTSWCEDGAVTLYPAYAFVSDQGERLTIPAVPDEALPPELMSEPAVAPDTDAEPAPGS